MRISDWSSDVCSSDLGSSRGPTAVTRKSTSASTFTCGPSGSRAREGWNGWSSSERGWTKPEMQSEPGRRTSFPADWWSRASADRKSVVEGKGGSGGVDSGGSRNSKKKKKEKTV